MRACYDSRPCGGLDTRLLGVLAARVASLMGEQSKAPGGVSALRSSLWLCGVGGVRYPILSAVGCVLISSSVASPLDLRHLVLLLLPQPRLDRLLPAVLSYSVPPGWYSRATARCRASLVVAKFWQRPLPPACSCADDGSTCGSTVAMDPSGWSPRPRGRCRRCRRRVTSRRESKN